MSIPNESSVITPHSTSIPSESPIIIPSCNQRIYDAFIDPLFEIIDIHEDDDSDDFIVRPSSSNQREVDHVINFSEDDSVDTVHFDAHIYYTGEEFLHVNMSSLYHLHVHSFYLPTHLIESFTSLWK